MTWDRDLVRILARPGKRPVKGWKFQWDPRKQGQSEGWHEAAFDDSSWFDIATDRAWEDQDVGRRWKREHGEDYDGLAWYRTIFTTPPGSGKRRRLLFGAVDEACIVWINGKLLLRRPYPYQGDTHSWSRPFELDVTGSVKSDGPNCLAVRVEDNTGAGGIWKPVWLVESSE